MVARNIPVETFDLVIFGGTGDLARRKILPALYRRMQAGQMPHGARVIGAARSKMTAEEFRHLVQTAFDEYLPNETRDQDTDAAFAAALDYVQIDAQGDDGWQALAQLLRDGVVRAFYLSVGPSLFGDIADRLTSFGIAGDQDRIVVEKPFGHDCASARRLNARLRANFSENQIYRIDHYLGKETVQNLMAVRFANALFEPLWNADHIDHVQITVAESISVAGRGGYYDKSGAMRDMVQNHMMQLLCLIAMEPPGSFEPDAVRDEKLKVINALKPLTLSDTIRGQYLGDDDESSYVDHAENPQSRTESFVALKVEVANWRWANTPFYLRTGKRMKKRLSEIAIVFKDPPHSIFAEEPNLHGNRLIIRLQPDEGISLSMAIKDPGPGGMRLSESLLDMSLAQIPTEAGTHVPDAYERLIMDVIRGNQTLFMRGDEAEAAWGWTDPIIEMWQNLRDKPRSYDPGSSGPDDALMLMHRDGRKWREIM